MYTEVRYVDWTTQRSRASCHGHGHCSILDWHGVRMVHRLAPRMVMSPLKQHLLSLSFSLTDIEVLTVALRGDSCRAVGLAVHLSESRVRNILSRAYRILAVRSRSELIAKFAQPSVPHGPLSWAQNMESRAE